MPDREAPQPSLLQPTFLTARPRGRAGLGDALRPIEGLPRHRDARNPAYDRR